MGINIQIAQIAPRLGRIDDNFQLHADILHQASGDGVDLLVFPELSLTGYLLKDLVSEVALTQKEVMDRFSALQGITNLEAVIGFVEETPGYRYHNAAMWLKWDDQGQLHLVHLHRKIYLPTYGLFDEGRYFSAGRAVRSFHSPLLGRCGILICEDAWHVSVPLLLSLDGPLLEGASLLVVLSNSPARGVPEQAAGIPTSHQVWRNLLSTYSNLFEVVVVYANRCGVEDGLVFAGGSQVYAGGECLLEVPLFEPGPVNLHLDWPELLRRARVGSQVSASENADLLHRELERILRKSLYTS